MGEARQELIIVEAVSRILLLRDLFDLLHDTSSYCPFQYFLGQKASGLDQPCGAATMLHTDSGQWKPYYDLLEPVVGHAHPPWRI